MQAQYSNDPAPARSGPPAARQLPAVFGTSAAVTRQLPAVPAAPVPAAAVPAAPAMR